MNRVLKHLLNQKRGHGLVTLYYPGLEFTGALDSSTDEEMIALIRNGHSVFLDSTSLIGFSCSADLQMDTGADSKESAFFVEAQDSYYKDEILALLQEISACQRPEGSVIDLIKTNVRERVRNYLDIKKETESIIRQMENDDSMGVDQELLLRTKDLKIRKPGCCSALNTLDAGLHYAGGNKEKAIELLWKAGRFDIALIVISEIWDEEFYLDCLGNVINDPEFEGEGLYRETFCYYIKRCAQIGDISWLITIIESALMNGQDMNIIFDGALYYLLQNGRTPEAFETIEEEGTWALLRKVKQLYPSRDSLLKRQDALQEQLNRRFESAPEKIKEKGDRLANAYSIETGEMLRPEYYIGIVSDRFAAENSSVNFRVKLNLNQTEGIYMHPYQIADPLLLHKLITSPDYYGTKICFRFGYNDKGICAADAVMARSERCAYRESLMENLWRDYETPKHFNYLSNEYDESRRLEYGKDLLEQAAREARNEDIDQVELIIFFNNYIMNGRAWRSMGYPCAIKDCLEITAYLEDRERNDGEDMAGWAEEFVQLLNRTGHRDWGDIFRSMREGMSTSNPLYASPRRNPSSVSQEILMNDYIFPGAAKGDYEYVLECIRHWREKSAARRRNNQKQLMRIEKLEEVCKAGIEGRQEEFSRRVLELREIVTETQKRRLEPLFERAGI